MLLYIGIVFAVVFGCFVILFFSLPIYDAWPTKKYDKYYEMSFSKEEWDQVKDKLIWNKQSFWTKYTYSLDASWYYLTHAPLLYLEYVCLHFRKHKD